MLSNGVDTVFFLGSIFGVPLESYRSHEDVLCKELMQMERAKACKASRYTWQDQVEFQNTKLYQVRDSFDRKADGQKQNKPYPVTLESARAFESVIRQTSQRVQDAYHSFIAQGGIVPSVVSIAPASDVASPAKVSVSKESVASLVTKKRQPTRRLISESQKRLTPPVTKKRRPTRQLVSKVNSEDDNNDEDDDDNDQEDSRVIFRRGKKRSKKDDPVEDEFVPDEAEEFIPSTPVQENTPPRKKTKQRFSLSDAHPRNLFGGGGRNRPDHLVDYQNPLGIEYREKILKHGKLLGKGSFASVYSADPVLVISEYPPAEIPEVWAWKVFSEGTHHDIMKEHIDFLSDNIESGVVPLVKNFTLFKGGIVTMEAFDTKDGWQTLHTVMAENYYLTTTSEKNLYKSHLICLLFHARNCLDQTVEYSDLGNPKNILVHTDFDQKIPTRVVFIEGGKVVHNVEVAVNLFIREKIVPMLNATHIYKSLEEKEFAIPLINQ